MGGIRNLEAELFKALAHPTRIKILELLRDGEKCVCEIVPLLCVGQPTASQHLAILKNSNLAKSEKKGVSVFYSVTNKKIFDILDLAREIIVEDFKEKKKMLNL